ncbi:unnamed protein product, partial [Ectocarpus fasciculatus]
LFRASGYGRDQTKGRRNGSSWFKFFDWWRRKREQRILLLLLSATRDMSWNPFSFRSSKNPSTMASADRDTLLALYNATDG